ncbi:MAG: class I SAM-dependent methyltransferase [Candidatus Heimdallarchaeota archaeon]|nr:class I SAM-dependent methyltransferase [Candidatus Heimdallarchaeota archaeon]MDH5645521.1 class I SAM-dependent methyltransferase [Candidatus Heimdallarchaeota archaeon]
MQDHWNNIYRSKDTTELGWYEDSPDESLFLIKQSEIKKDHRILDVGSGSSKLIDTLIEEGYSNIIALDLSEEAFIKSKIRIGNKSSLVKWVVGNILEIDFTQKIGSIDLWHDRAMLHFLIEPEDQNRYFNLIKHHVTKGGHVVLATFAKSTVSQCSGLDILNYDLEMFRQRLGVEFILVETKNFTYTMPSGSTRNYIYVHFQKIID